MSDIHIHNYGDSRRHRSRFIEDDYEEEDIGFFQYFWYFITSKFGLFLIVVVFLAIFILPDWYRQTYRPRFGQIAVLEYFFPQPRKSIYEGR